MINVRAASPLDFELIASFQMAMAWETEHLRLNKKTVVAGVKAVFANASVGKYFVAVQEEAVVASLLITYEWSDWRNGTVYWIQSVYVKPEFRNQGVFKTLYQHIKEIVLKDDRVMGIRLYVDKNNLRARQVYERLQMNGDHYAFYEWMK